MISVSIIIVTYNSEKEIANCINSLLPQLGDINGEIIIIDNNSTDNTVPNINEIDNSNILIIQNDENVGYTKANNQGIDISKGEYILFLNPDTILQNDKIINLLNKLKTKMDLGAIAPQLRFPDGRIQKSCRRFPRRRDVLFEVLGLSKLFKNSKEFNHWKMGDFDHKETCFVEQPAGAALMVGKKVIDDIGGFDEQFPMFFSDVDLCKQIILSGKKVLFTPEINIIHIGGKSIKENYNKMIVSSHLSFWKYFNKYYTSFFDRIYNIFTGLILIVGIPLRIILNIIFPSSTLRKRDIL